jgi:hypothetical protein
MLHEHKYKNGIKNLSKMWWLPLVLGRKIIHISNRVFGWVGVGL